MSVPPASTPGALPPCPRCGRQAPSGIGPFCPWCGRYLAALEWVASPPDPGTVPESVRAPSAPPRARRYPGPPRYRTPPRWGLPVGPWRYPPGPQDGPVPVLERVRGLSAQLVPVLWVTLGACALAAVAEVWRYGLLLASRADALSASAVGWSDALVWFGGWASVAATLASGVLLVQWSLWASRAAADRAGTRPARSRRTVVLGWLVPGWNLVAPGSLLAETEHAALELPAGRTPRPSRELLVWWALWGVCVALAAVTLLWRLRSGTQALADGVVLHAWLDVLAAVTAWRTVRVVRRISGLLEPSPQGRRELLVRPSQATGPARAGSRPAAAPVTDPPGASPTAGPDGHPVGADRSVEPAPAADRSG